MHQNVGISTLISPLRHTLLKCLEGIDVTHYNDKHLYNLSKEALIADFLSLLHHSLYLLPDPLLSGWVRPLLRGMHLLLTEESLNKLGDQLWFEEVIELPLIVGTRECKWHKSKLKHVVFGFVACL